MSRSEEKSDPKVKFLSITLAIVLTLFWAFLIAGTWYFFKIKGNVYEDTIVNWVARFHILAVHFPIGLIFLVVLLEFFGRMPGFANLRSAVSFVLWITLIGAIGASLLGFLLMEVEEYSSRAITLHMWTGLGVVVLTLITLVLKLKEVRVFYSVALLLTVIGVSAAGHYGGASVHGANYLAKDAPGPLKKVMRGGLPESKRPASSLKEESTTPKVVPPKPATETKPDAAVTPKKDTTLVYQELIEPMLEKTCYDCHSDNGKKPKGKLRMDSIAHLLKGGDSEFPSLVQGKPDDSEILLRVLLDPDDDEFMPTKGDPIDDQEVALLRMWIKAGGDAKVTVADLGEGPKVKATVDAVKKILAEHKAKPKTEPKSEE